MMIEHNHDLYGCYRTAWILWKGKLVTVVGQVLSCFLVYMYLFLFLLPPAWVLRLSLGHSGCPCLVLIRSSRRIVHTHLSVLSWPIPARHWYPLIWIPSSSEGLCTCSSQSNSFECRPESVVMSFRHCCSAVFITGGIPGSDRVLFAGGLLIIVGLFCTTQIGPFTGRLREARLLWFSQLCRRDWFVRMSGASVSDDV